MEKTLARHDRLAKCWSTASLSNGFSYNIGASASHIYAAEIATVIGSRHDAFFPESLNQQEPTMITSSKLEDMWQQIHSSLSISKLDAVPLKHPKGRQCYGS
jgi:hypothetical protein